MLDPVRVGDVIASKYRIEKVLGRGGMGVVFAATHLGLRERVAVKLLTRAGAGRDLQARFVREGRLAMRIRSEHVVRVHDIGTLQTGEPFLVMEHLAGSDLAAVLDRDGPLPIADAVEYVLQAIEALAEAHARGIIHRDIKPANLFLSRRADGSPLVKILDFGIAKNTSPDETETGAAAALGTPVYMAPEQMRSGSVVDARTDVWALGVTLHTLLTGEAPFRAGSMVEIHERIQQGAPRLRASRPKAPEALELALLRCMQKEPGERYPGVAALAEALVEVAPVHARVSATRATRIQARGTIDDEAPPTDGEQHAPSPLAAVDRTDMAASASWIEAGLERSRSGEPPSPAANPTNARRWAIASVAVVSVISAIGALASRAATGPHGAVDGAAGTTALPVLAAPASAPASAPTVSATSSPMPTATARSDEAPRANPAAATAAAPAVRAPIRSRPSASTPDPKPSASATPAPLPHRDPTLDP